MANKPAAWSNEQWEKHRKEAEAETKRRAAVEASPTDTILDLQARVEALEGKKAPAPAKKAPAKKARAK